MKDIISLEFLKTPELAVIVGLIFGILAVVSLLFFIISKIKPRANIDELVSRTKSWWIMAVIFVAATVFNTTVSYVALAFLSFVAFRELYSLLGFRQSDRRAIFWAFVSIPIQYYLAYIGWYGAYIIFIPVMMFLLLPLRFIIKGDTEGITQSMSLLQWSLMLTVFGLSHMAYLLSLPELQGFAAGGLGLLFFLVFLTEINDVMQFTWGKLLGRRKIIPKVSPNKTWEGLIGGVICTTVIGSFLRFLTPLSMLEVLFVSFMIAIAGFVGDVVMSSIKRDVGVKDTGSIIPGHGGLLDRIDSLSYTAPTFFHLVYYLAY
jgi:phosphatidate cytidylyltransferase